ncbi:hypothetical protein GCWU000342_00161 [Shuttleworthella satelles DSM 14600]|uniref:Uncharacterized protein n=1 Tax=Shuttleworthella satelles DSM 14600 TaxID=626523 RepID=C4G7Z5_9FIRM|nr:hypothetical protein GCWU000342_00161 [Shuttleworthia satelles DSM 14600]
MRDPTDYNRTHGSADAFQSTGPVRDPTRRRPCAYTLNQFQSTGPVRDPTRYEDQCRCP